MESGNLCILFILVIIPVYLPNMAKNIEFEFLFVTEAG